MLSIIMQSQPVNGLCKPKTETAQSKSKGHYGRIYFGLPRERKQHRVKEYTSAWLPITEMMFIWREKHCVEVYIDSSPPQRKQHKAKRKRIVLKYICTTRVLRVAFAMCKNFSLQAGPTPDTPPPLSKDFWRCRR